MADDNFKALRDILGFDPTAHPSPTADVLKEVLGEIMEERTKKAKEQATKVLREALELHEKFTVAEKQYQQQKAKFNKELGKLVGSLQRMLKGQAPADASEAAEEPSA